MQNNKQTQIQRGLKALRYGLWFGGFISVGVIILIIYMIINYANQGSDGFREIFQGAFGFVFFLFIIPLILYLKLKAKAKKQLDNKRNH